MHPNLRIMLHLELCYVKNYGPMMLTGVLAHTKQSLFYKLHSLAHSEI